jgi:2,3-bisphosphoglycerate-dependent phosphoglycerate mutase
MPGKLVFMRHGQSEWNASGQFTGWVDVGLTDQGIEEATFGGQLLRDSKIKFDVMYTSVLKRAIRTGTIALQECNQEFVPIVKSWRLNERMYGALQGCNKKETVVEHGKEQVQIWRRSFDVPPPEIDIGNQYWPGRERHKYGNVPLKDIPLTECLKDVIARVMPFWEQNIMADVMAGKNVLVAAHGNSIRAICKYLDQIPDDVIPGLEIPTGIPLVYNLDDSGSPIPSEKAVAPLTGEFLVTKEELEKMQEAVRNQTKVDDAKPATT